MATRLLLSYADESEERTRAVIRRVFSPSAKPSDDRIDQWRALQTWLRLGDNKVVIPFGDALADKIATGQLRTRRDAASVRALIEASALLHQAQRDRDGDAIVATLDDYTWVEAATSPGLDAIAAGTEVDTAAVATAISRLLKTKRRQSVQREAARRLAALLHTRFISAVPATNRMSTQADLYRLSTSPTAAYGEVKALAIQAGLAISMKDRRDVLAIALPSAPTTVRVGGRKLAQAMGVSYKIARLRLQRAIEDGAVVDETPSYETRNHPSGRALRPADSTHPQSSARQRAIPTPQTLRSAWDQRL